MPEDSQPANPGTGAVPLLTTDDEDPLAGYETILNTVGDGVYQLDLDGRIVAVNDAIVELTGYSRDELVGEHVSLVLSPEDVEAVAADIRALHYADKDTVRTSEVTVYAADGTAVPVEVRFSLIVTDGKVEGTVGVLRDLSDRRERDLVERILEAVSVSVAVVDVDGNIVRANSRARERLGIEIHDGERSTVGDRDVYDEDGAFVPPEERPYMRVFETGEPVRNWQCQINLPDRGRRWFSINAVPIPAAREGGDVERVVVTADDVTPRKEQAHQLRRQRDELASELDEVFERIDDAFYALDEEFRFTYVNERAEELLQHAEEELLGRSVWEVFPETSETPAWKSFHEALETQEPTSFEVYYEPLGIWVEATVYPSESGLSVYFQDVTERKEREQELQRYETIVETTQEGIYATDAEGRFTLVNDAYLELTDCSREELLGTHPAGMIPDAAHDTVYQKRHELREGEREIGTREGHYETPDGTHRAVETRFTALTDANGQFLGTTGVARDITARKEREQELRRERDRFNTLFESIPEAVVHVQFEDGEPIIRNVNSEFEDVFGYACEDLAGASLNEYIVPERFMKEAAGLDDATMGLDRQEAEVRRCTADGERDFLFRGVPFETGLEPIEGIGVYIDITERKARERELEEYQALTRAASDAIVTIDESSIIQSINPAIEEMLGYTPEELSGESLTVLMPEDLTDEHTRAIERYLRTGERQLDWDYVELPGRHAEGHEVPLAISFSEIDHDDERFFTGIMRDITERKERERELKRQREQLAALDDFNRVVRKITDTVIEESTREEIERAACHQLVASDSYKFAWIAAVDPNTEKITPRVESGVEGYLRDIELSADPDERIGQGPAGQAFRTGEIRVSQDVFTDPDFEPWRDAAKQYGFRSFAAIPIVHEDTLYGMLGVYSERIGAFDDDERRVIGQLGEVVGHAINAYERKQALISDEAVELEFRAHDIYAGFGVPEPEQGRITFNQAVPLGDDEFLLYGTTTGDAFEALEALTEQLPQFEECKVVTETSDEVRYELHLDEPPVLSAVAAHGGRIQTATIEDGDYRLIVELPLGVSVRRITDVVQDTYPAAEVLAQRQITQRDRTPERIHQVLTDDLTDRQRTALISAYYAGFFNWPRESTGEEIAASMDLAPATFHQHLRMGEKKLLKALIAEETPLG